MNSSNSSDFWKNVKQIGLNSKNNVLPPNIDLNALNASFIQNSSDDINDVNQIDDMIEINHFSLQCVDELTVGLTILEIKSKATGSDNIHPDFIKMILPFLIRPITHIFNTIIMTSTFPNAWKIAKIIPLPKTSATEYRPIAILPFLSKVFEKLISRQLRLHFSKNKLISNFQSGFQPRRSCITALVKVSDDIREGFDEGKIGIIGFLDFSKAFDCVKHSILLKKLLNQFSVGITSCNLLRSYLGNRSQYIDANGQRSSRLLVPNGVPQGSILGPLLFSVFINDIVNCFSKVNFHIYADDIQIYSMFYKSSLNTAVTTLNSELSNVYQWSIKNKLTLNPSKSKAMLLGRSNITGNVPMLYLGTDVLEYTEKMKNLGVYFTSKLDWKTHINYITSRIYGALRGLSPASDFLSIDVKLKLVKSYIVPIILYGCELFSNMTSDSHKRLKVAFNSCTRFIFGKKRHERISQYSKQVLGCSIFTLIKYRTLLFLRNIVIDKEPEYLFCKLRFGRGSRTIPLIIPRHNYSVCSKQFMIFSIQIWNQIPLNIRYSSILTFKTFIINLFEGNNSDF